MCLFLTIWPTGKGNFIYGNSNTFPKGNYGNKNSRCTQNQLPGPSPNPQDMKLFFKAVLLKPGFTELITNLRLCY